MYMKGSKTPHIWFRSSRDFHRSLNSHPLATLGLTRHVDGQTYQCVTVHHTFVTPVPFDFLSFLAGGAEVIRYFQDRFSQPLAGHVSSVIKLKGKQHLESPPVAAHRWFFRGQ